MFNIEKIILYQIFQTGVYEALFSFIFSYILHKLINF